MFTININPSIVNQQNNIERLLKIPQDVIEKELNNFENFRWIKNEKLAYKLCKVIDIKNDKVFIEDQDENGIIDKKYVELKNTYLTSLSHFCEDMCNLTELNEPSVLHTIYSRYKYKLIHTYSGLFCVVVNPWQNLPLYTREIIDYYMNESKVNTNLPPHIYLIAQRAYEGIYQGSILNSFQNSTSNYSQSILITGESGAGKTENTKKIIEYLILQSAKTVTIKCMDLSIKKLENKLETAILNAGIALEAFSNAKTTHNNNSSRLGKFIRLDFNNNAKLCSARIDCYLLEKSRVVNQNEGHRNFHIFYQIFTSAFYNISDRKLLNLNKEVHKYRFLNQGNCVIVPEIDDYNNGLNTKHALNELGFSEKEKTNIFKCVAACILIGEIHFNERQGLDISYVVNMLDIENVTKLIGLNTCRLVDALTQPSIRIGENVIRKNQNLKKTLASTAAFAKILYEKMFNWIVNKCNSALNLQNITDTKQFNNLNKDNFIGVLDMAGFEIMNQNSFEQFCINYTNEKLQQFFNQVFFVKEQNEYINEGIDWCQINFEDNLQKTITLIEKPMGILSLLQEECIVPNGNDYCLLEKLCQTLISSSNGILAKIKYSTKNIFTNHFTISHYAGKVAYNIDGWVEKNRDLVDQSILEVLSNSTHKFINQLFAPLFHSQQEMTKSKRGNFISSTISCIYKEQLNYLIQILNLSSPHFIRCIVPNYEKKSFVLNRTLVMNQLKCNGVLEGIRVYQSGYPNRILFKEFLNRYQILCSNQNTNVSQFLAVKNMCLNLKLDLNQYKIGKTKIFCRTGIISNLEERRKERINILITKLQANIRWYLEQKNFVLKIQNFEATIIIQKSIHNYLNFIHWPWFKLWLKIKDLIPLAKDKKRLQELNIENINLKKENEWMKLNIEELEKNNVFKDKKIDHLTEENSIISKKCIEAKKELKQSENLLELMEKKFDNQHAKIMKLNNSLNENIKILEKLEKEKQSLELNNATITTQLKSELEKNFLIEKTLKEEKDKTYNFEKKINSMFDELKVMDKNIKNAEDEVFEWKDKYNKKTNEISVLNDLLTDANEKTNKFEITYHEERNLRCKRENEVDELEEQNNYLRTELQKADVKREATKEQCRVKDNVIKKLERKLEDKSIEMETCVAELKKIHKSSQTNTQNQIEELKKKCTKLEYENKHQKSLLESVSTNFNFQNLSYNRELNYEADSNRNFLQGRYETCRYLISSSLLNIGGSNYGYNLSNSSLRTLFSGRRRETESELVRSFNNRHQLDVLNTGNSVRSLSNSSLTNSIRLSRNATFSNLTTSICNTADSGLTRSLSSCSNATQLQNNEKKIAQLERDLQLLKTDNNILKRELDVYKESLQDLEQNKEGLIKQTKHLNSEIYNLTELVKTKEEKNQKLCFDVKKTINDNEALKKQNEEIIQDLKNEFCIERKKYTEKLEEMKHNYELKFHSLSKSQKNYEKLQKDLLESQSQLDKTMGQISQLKKIQKTQTTIDKTWESQYREAMQELESLRDENAALKSKIRRQYKQIELLTQQDELNEYVNNLVTKADNLQNNLEKTEIIPSFNM